LAGALLLMGPVSAASAAPAARQPSTGNLFVLTASAGTLRPVVGQQGAFTLVLRAAPRQPGRARTRRGP
jgi:hypothetical protein